MSDIRRYSVEENYSEVIEGGAVWIRSTDHDALIASLREQLQQAQRDAERYRYLRTELSAVQTFPSEFEVSFMLRKPVGWKFHFNSSGLDDYLDKLAAHDAALASRTTTGEGM